MWEGLEAGRRFLTNHVWRAGRKYPTDSSEETKSSWKSVRVRQHTYLDGGVLDMEKAGGKSALRLQLSLTAGGCLRIEIANS